LSTKLDYKEWEIDALTEVCSIGAGHAATALSQLLDRKVTISVPEFAIVGLSDLPEVMGGAETRATAVYVRVLGAVNGNMLFMLSQESAISLAAILRGHEPGGDQPTSTDRKIIKQAGAVTISSYLSALTRFLDVPLIPSEASIADDMVGAILDIVIAELGARADYGLMVKTEFIDESASIAARICFLPDPEAQQVILKKLGVK